jgi:DNA-damage-inducible protein J
VDSFDILEDMRLATRSAILQARVYPGIKRASEDVLRRMGLTMTEAVELFLRRVIVDQRIPFEVIALDPETLAVITEEAEQKKIRTHLRRKSVRHRPRSRGGGG